MCACVRVRAEFRVVKRVRSRVLEILSVSFHLPRLICFSLCFKAEDDIQLQKEEAQKRTAEQRSEQLMEDPVLRESTEIEALAAAAKVPSEKSCSIVRAAVNPY